jgi:hypothetical protein
LWLVVPGWVEDEVAQELTVLSQDPDVQVVNEDQDAGAGVASAETDVVQAAVVAQGDDAAGIDEVASDPGMWGEGERAGGDGFGAGGVGHGGRPPADGAVRALGVVGVAEAVELGLELVDGCGARLAGQPFLEGLVEAFDLAAGGGW